MVLPLPALIATIYVFTDWDLSKCRKVRRHLEPNFIYSLVIKVVVLVMDSTGAPRLLGVSPAHYIQDCNPAQVPLPRDQESIFSRQIMSRPR